jgi:hypothetical protein
MVCCAAFSLAQAGGSERAFPQSKATIEKVLKEMQAATSGRLPALEGFATSADHPLDRYQRGYYQAKFQVTAGPAGGAVVHVSVEVTAWYADPVASRSGYHLLTSNGRLETDLLDQLSDQLAAKPPAAGSATTASAGRTSSGKGNSGSAKGQSGRTSAAQDSAIPAPMPRIPDAGSGLSTSLAQGLAERGKAGAAAAPDKTDAGLRAEAESLEEVLKSQSHPRNLVVVKKTGTAVVASASLSAKTLFLANAHDEFEMLDFNRDWVHVHISGLSRGWIWRNNLEMPEGIPDTDTPSSASPTAAEIFHMTRQEEAPFPGDWAPLRGKRVKIVSVEKIDENAKGADAGPRVKLEFTKAVLDSNYADLAKKSQDLAGIVLIFDSADGGMIAATFAVLQQWKAGKLTDAALWHQCFFDPPETFSTTGSAASH